MDFLSQTEQKLTTEISGNYQSLVEQQKDHEVREDFKTTCLVTADFICTALLSI